jgi:hypothetical protein
VRYGLENLVGKYQHDWRDLAKQDIIDEAFILLKHE